MLDQRISAKTLRFAVLGESLAHTWSPQIHNSLFSAAGLDAVYLPVTVPKEKLSSAVDVLRSCFSGFNVTIPYKERIISMLDEVDATALACGAVNTVENREGRLIGHNTDGLGMMRAIEEGGVNTHAASVLILGGGGAARVACYEILERGGNVNIAVRSLQKGQRLATELADIQADGIKRISVSSMDEVTGEYDIAINCTPVGMYPRNGESPVSEDVIERCRAVFDAVYNPRETRFLQTARQHGIAAIEGLGMLYYQAVEAEKLWFGREAIANDETQKRVYLELLEQM